MLHVLCEETEVAELELKVCPLNKSPMAAHTPTTSHGHQAMPGTIMKTASRFPTAGAWVHSGHIYLHLWHTYLQCRLSCNALWMFLQCAHASNCLSTSGCVKYTGVCARQMGSFEMRVRRSSRGAGGAGRGGVTYYANGYTNGASPIPIPPPGSAFASTASMDLSGVDSGAPIPAVATVDEDIDDDESTIFLTAPKAGRTQLHSSQTPREGTQTAIWLPPHTQQACCPWTGP